MPSLQSKKRKSDAAGLDGPATLENGQNESARTPTGSPASKKMRITQSQKQALIDNLQLEITERARKLRAHYALQAQDLRSRIERRVNRIPLALRKTTVGELLAKHAELTQPKQLPTSTAVESTTNAHKPSRPLPPIPKDVSSSNPASAATSPAHTRTKRGVKRPSSSIDIASDKENAGPGPNNAENDTLSNPKNPKRAKPNPTTQSTRAASRTTKAAPNGVSQVLSPKSNNSRTLLHSPIRGATTNNTNTTTSPTKPSYLARPVSPLKPASPLKTATTAAGAAISASLAGMVEHAKAAAKNTRAGAEKAGRKITPKGAAAAKAKKNASSANMGPPAGPASATNANNAVQHDRSVSNSTNSSSVSGGSTGTTVVTASVSKKGGKTRVSASSTTTRKTPATSKGAVAKKTTTAATAKKSVKDLVVEQPAAGRRVLRNRG